MYEQNIVKEKIANINTNILIKSLPSVFKKGGLNHHITLLYIPANFYLGIEYFMV